MKTYIVGGKRTAFGSFGGSLKSLSPVDLAKISSEAALSQAGISAEQVDHVVLGSVICSTTDTTYGGRHLALKLGCRTEVPGYNVNRLCGSGIQSIYEGMMLIEAGRADVVIAGGSENMSLTPHLLYGARFGTKYGSPETKDYLLDSLTDQYAGCSMGVTAENLAEKYDISRTEAEEFSKQSHEKYHSALDRGEFKDEIISVPLKKGELAIDEHPRREISMEDMEKLRASFKKDGTVTPATASGIVDGAASVVLVSEKFLDKNPHVKSMVRVVDVNVAGVPPEIMGIGPVPVIKNLLASASLSMNDLDAIEINEAFAAQTIACQRELNINPELLNKKGGAVAIGHPLAATGTRITITLMNYLLREKKKRGIASACIGGGQGIGLLMESVS